jgi:hypothetical protein
LQFPTDDGPQFGNWLLMVLSADCCDLFPFRIDEGPSKRRHTKTRSSLLTLSYVTAFMCEKVLQAQRGLTNTGMWSRFKSEWYPIYFPCMKVKWSRLIYFVSPRIWILYG